MSKCLLYSELISLISCFQCEASNMSETTPFPFLLSLTFLVLIYHPHSSIPFVFIFYSFQIFWVPKGCNHVIPSNEHFSSRALSRLSTTDRWHCYLGHYTQTLDQIHAVRASECLPTRHSYRGSREHRCDVYGKHYNWDAATSFSGPNRYWEWRLVGS